MSSALTPTDSFSHLLLEFSDITTPISSSASTKHATSFGSQTVLGLHLYTLYPRPMGVGTLAVTTMGSTTPLHPTATPFPVSRTL